MLRSRSSSSSTPSSSPTSSPTKKKNRLSLSGLFVKMRGVEEKAVSTDELVLSSGDPKTHPYVAEGAKDQDKVPVEQTDHFVCSGGVNLPMLLRITRIALMEHVERRLGANSVVNEQWECTISGPKPVRSRTYKVQIRYSASATISSVPDCRRPVALDKATSVPGLMSILKRNDT